MGQHARIGLLLGAAACLLAVMVDWVIEDLNRHEEAERSMQEAQTRPVAATPAPTPSYAGQASGSEAGQGGPHA
jgi:hypothetical protein